MIIGVVVAIAVMLGAFLVASSVSFGNEPTQNERNKITKWHGGTTVEDEKDVVALTRCGKQCRRHNRIKRWKTRTYRRGAFRGDCRRISTISVGGNAFDRSIVRAGMSSSWCWRDGKVTRYHMDTWGEADGWSLWDYNGVSDVVKHCRHTPCKRVYRRTYFKFRRGLGSLSQNEVTWIAHSLRPRGGYDVDRR